MATPHIAIETSVDIAGDAVDIVIAIRTLTDDVLPDPVRWAVGHYRGWHKVSKVLLGRGRERKTDEQEQWQQMSNLKRRL